MAATVALNTSVTFGSEGTIRDYAPFGLDLTEKAGSWTVKETAGFSATIAVLPPGSNLFVQIEAAPFVHKGLTDCQQIFVYMNGLWVGFHNLRSPDVMEFEVPRAAISARGTKLCFVIPTAISPKAQGIGADARRLGMVVSNVKFVAKN